MQKNFHDQLFASYHAYHIPPILEGDNGKNNTFFRL